MKNQIIRKIENAIERYGMKGYTDEELYISLKESTGSEFSLLSECYGLAYDEENYILYSNGSDLYSLDCLCSKIKTIVENSLIDVKLIRECHHIYDNLEIWRNYDEMDLYQMEYMCDCENLFLDAINCVKMGNQDKALSCMVSILNMVAEFN